MLRNRKILFSLFLLPLLISCASNNVSESINDNSGSDNSSTSISSSTAEEEDIYSKGYSTLTIDDEEYYVVCDGLYVNKEPGIYKEDFMLKFAYNKNNSSLYYNYSGEKPLKNSICSLAPFEELEIYENVPEGDDEIPMSTSVDEILDSRNDRCVSDNYINNVQNPGKYSYFHNAIVVDITFVKDKVETDMAMTYLVDSVNKYTIPVVSLSMPYRKWFGSPYYFYNNIKEEAEARVQLEFFDPVTKDYWQRNSKIKLGGGWSKGYPQRTLNLNFNKDEKGNKNKKVDYPIFGDRKACGNPEKDLTKHIRFRLHNGGNCFEQWSGFNDAILQRAMFGTNIATTAYRPCLVYLNGEYWGLMSLREHYCDYYIEQNYGVDKDNVTMFEVKGNIIFDDGDEDGVEYINELNSFLNDSRFTSGNQTLIEEAYQELTQMVDVDSFIDALISEFYCCNWDYVGNYNNLKMWRSMKTSSKKYEDGKWRFCLHDADFAFSETTNYFDKNHTYSYNKWPLVKACMRSKTFRGLLVQRAEQLAETNLAVQNLTNITNVMYDAVRPYKKDFGKRWGQPNNYYNTWLDYFSYLTNYYETRTNSFVNQLKTVINNQYGGYQNEKNRRNWRTNFTYVHVDVCL